jgi:hypothetical protein
MLPNFPNRIKMLNEHVVSTMYYEAYQGLKKKKKSNIHFLTSVKMSISSMSITLSWLFIS